jgi:hypothetical protein
MRQKIIMIRVLIQCLAVSVVTMTACYTYFKLRIAYEPPYTEATVFVIFLIIAWLFDTKDG